MTIKYSSATAIARANATVDQIDAGSGAGKLKVYAGTEPTNAEDPITTQTLLGIATLSDPAFGDAVDIGGSARATANAVGTITILVDGTPSFFRLTDSDDNVVLQDQVGGVGSGKPLTFDGTSWQEDQVAVVSSLTYTEPEVS